MRWQRDLEGVPRRLVGGGWQPEPVAKIWAGRCGSCKFTAGKTFGSVTCTVTGRKMSPCAECDVP